MFLITLLLGALALLYVWLKWNYSYWKRKKVSGPEPTFFVGNVGPMFTFSEHWGVETSHWHKEYSNEPYIGYYKLLKPSILARDPDLIKDILITNFNSFRYNDAYLSKKYDPLISTNPFFTRDDEWRKSRKIFLSVFSQAKIKTIMPIMNGVGADFVKYLKVFSPDTDLNAKDISVRFTTENVIKCAFSIDPGCFNKEHESEFLAAGTTLFAPSILVGIKFMLMLILPQWFINIIPVPFVPHSIDKLFRNLVGTNKASRSKNFQSNDIIQMLLQIQAKYNLDEEFLAGHSLSLFLDGTETSSTTMSYTLYALAENPHCQAKLFGEIVKITSKYDGNLTAEGLQEMIYLDGIILETLRRYPAFLVLTKLCTQQYTLPKTSQQSEALTIQPGAIVNISVKGVHMDPNNYPKPEEFIPERFNEEEQRNRHSGTFLGFGEGPRTCPGMRFAMAQVKVALAHIVQNFRVQLSPNHKPIVIDPQTLLSYPKDGILIQLEAR